MWEEGSLSFWVGLFPVNEDISAFVRDKMRARHQGPEGGREAHSHHLRLRHERVPLETN
jgi:hypothetical protein